MRGLFTVISMSGCAFITRDPLFLVRIQQKTRDSDWFSPFLEDLTVRLVWLFVDHPRSQVTHFVRQGVSDTLCKRVDKRAFGKSTSQPLRVSILVASSISEDSSPCRFLLGFGRRSVFGGGQDLLVPTCATSGSEQPRVPGEFCVGWKPASEHSLVQVIEKVLCVFF